MWCWDANLGWLCVSQGPYPDVLPFQPNKLQVTFSRSGILNLGLLVCSLIKVLLWQMLTRILELCTPQRRSQLSVCCVCRSGTSELKHREAPVDSPFCHTGSVASCWQSGDTTPNANQGCVWGAEGGFYPAVQGTIQCGGTALGLLYAKHRFQLFEPSPICNEGSCRILRLLFPHNHREMKVRINSGVKFRFWA